MFGKIFENLLEDNKDKGAFYIGMLNCMFNCRMAIEKVPTPEVVLGNGDGNGNKTARSDFRTRSKKEIIKKQYLWSGYRKGSYRYCTP